MRWLWIPLCLVLSMAQIAEPTTELFDMMRLPQDDWFDLRMMGVKVGHTHLHIVRDEYQGQEAIRVRSEMRINLKRSGIGIELERTKVAHIDANFQPLHFVTHSNESGEEKRVEGWVQDGEIRLRTSLSGETEEDRKPLPENVTFEEMLGFLALHRGLGVGDTYQINVFNLELFRSIPTTVTLAREDSVEYEGRSVPVMVVEYYLDLMGGIESAEWLTRDGTTYRMEMSTFGISMEMIRTDRDTALGEVGEIDVILSTRILPQGPSPLMRRPYFKARVALTDGSIREAIMRTDEQSLTAGPDAQEGILEIRRRPLSPEETRDLPITDPDLQMFLQPTVYVQANDPAIQAKAREIIGDETNAWLAAQAICHWVYSNIEDKNLHVGFGSAAQTLRTLEGDCTEHTVLLTALARSVGIPTRIVAGLVYQGEAFYYHFWPEVYVGTRWVQVEPTLGQAQADATHIQLAGGYLESESVLEFGEGVLRTLNQLQIETLVSE